MALASNNKEVIVLQKTQKKDLAYVMKSLLAGGEDVINVLVVNTFDYTK